MVASIEPSLETITSQPENPFSKLIPSQHIKLVPSFTLESGVVLYNVPVAYSTRGQLSPECDNAMVICHALSGSADVSDWWGPLLGKTGKAFDVTRFFIICINSLGSPYGTASPVTYVDGDPEKGIYGPDFPLTSIRDDVNLSKRLLDGLGVKQIAAVIGGSMGGMLVLEFAYFGKDYVKCIVPIATSARHSAWCISWGEAQRQSIYSDPKYQDGYYTSDNPPATGLGAARMSALLTYRSRNSFESRFGRNVQTVGRQSINQTEYPATPSSRHFAIHNDGHKHVGTPRKTSNSRPPSREPSVDAGKDGSNLYFDKIPSTAHNPAPPNSTNPVHPPPAQHTNPPMTLPIQDPEFHGSTASPTAIHPPSAPPRRPNGAPRSTTNTSSYFSAQSYLRYQGDKFIKRFDANCYIAITRKLDSHDVSFHSPEDHFDPDQPPEAAVATALGLIQQPTLVLGIESDGLFTFAEQQEIAAGIRGARLEKIDSPEGHDAFLLQFEQVNRFIVEFLGEALPEIMAREPMEVEAEAERDAAGAKESVFGEAEVEDITAW
ncbi:MAG: homoserine O- acetyltransferase [Chrysothrix sp. TS-e1954]|nr:MAG: homoserine O- acetyltransferase [Chrysothrix sp. TS-e1954]